MQVITTTTNRCDTARYARMGGFAMKPSTNKAASYLDVSGCDKDSLMLFAGSACDQIRGLVQIALENYESANPPKAHELERTYHHTQALLFAIDKYAQDLTVYIDAHEAQA